MKGFENFIFYCYYILEEREYDLVYRSMDVLDNWYCEWIDFEVEVVGEWMGFFFEVLEVECRIFSLS